MAAHLGQHRRHRRVHAHHRADLVVAAVTALALLLVDDRVVQREEGGALVRLQRFLRRQGLHRPRELRPGGGLSRLARHPLDVVEDVLGQARVPVDLHRGGEVGERLHAVAAEDREPLHRRRGLESCSTVRVTSGRSWSMAPSMLATSVAVRRRAAILFCSTRSSASRCTVQIVEAPKPTTSTATMRTEILMARRLRSMGDRIT